MLSRTDKLILAAECMLVVMGFAIPDLQPLITVGLLLAATGLTISSLPQFGPKWALPWRAQPTWTPLVDVARRAYEATRGTIAAGIAERGGGADGTLHWYSCAILERWEVFGKYPPSEKMERVALHGGRLDVTKGIATIVDSYREKQPLWTDLSVKSAEVDAAVEKIKAFIGDAAKPAPHFYRSEMELGHIACHAAGKPPMTPITSGLELTLYVLLRDAANDGRLDMADEKLHGKHDEHSLTRPDYLLAYANNYTEALPFQDVARSWKDNAQPRYVRGKAGKLESVSKLHAPTVTKSQPDEDTSLDMVVQWWIAERSAWGRWQRAQGAASSGNAWMDMQFYCSALLRAAEKGDVIITAARGDEIERHALSLDFWRVAALQVKADTVRIWRVFARPRDGVSEAVAKKITEARYHDLTAKLSRVKEVWPEHDAKTDAVTKSLLDGKKGAEPNNGKDKTEGEI